jgi:5-methylthioadenosine/S-adenosylhomocysteine deaminase
MSLLLKNGTIITLNNKDRIIQDGAVYVERNKIIDVGSTSRVVRERNADHVIDARNQLILPGLINAHAHLSDILVRGLGSDLPLLTWLKRLIWPFFAEAKAEEIFYGELLGCLEAIESGTTSVIENYYPHREKGRNIDHVGKAFQEAGLRAVLARGYHDRAGMIPDYFVEGEEEVLREYRRIIRNWNGGADDRIRVCVSPVDLLFCTPSSIKTIYEMARQNEITMHSHVAESISEVNLVKKEYGNGYIEVLNKLGVLGPHFQAAHSVWVDEGEMDILAQTGTVVVHNPASNMYLGSGIAPIPRMIRKGVNVALGTDGACCNNSLDMFESIKLAALIHKGSALRPEIIHAHDVLKMATVNGSKAMGMGNRIGSIDIGKIADIILLDRKATSVAPMHDPIASIVYSAKSSNVKTVIVDGRIIMQDRNILTMNKEKVVEKAIEKAEDLVERVPALNKLKH